MTVKPSAPVCWGWISVWILVCSAAPDQINITAKPGDNVTLPCRAPSSTDITVVEWIRPDLEPEYVFMYRDKQSDPENQHPSFKDLVELEDSEMKDGDVSLVLRNVTTGDSGPYECHVVQGKTNHRKRSTFNTDPISIIHLSVRQPGSTGGHPGEGGDEDGGDKDGGNMERNSRGHVGLIVGLSVPVMVVVVVSVLLKCKRHMKKNPHPPDEVGGGSVLLKYKIHMKKNPHPPPPYEVGGGSVLLKYKIHMKKNPHPPPPYEVGGGSVLMKYKRHMKKNPHPPPPPDEGVGDQQLL